ncbi:MAG: flagellar hook-associated protein FlgK [Rhodospirillales bacterium]|nr:flagellar hook-associated protein FlgK [Rhodospirillales bacterium]
MAGSITLALQTARSGLLANQQALDAVANNISNVNSAGYSRKVVNLEARVVSATGAGVQISAINRKIDEGLLKSMRQEFSSLEEISVQENYYARLQEMFGSPEGNTSISHIMTEFANALESLTLNPDKTLEQNEVIRWGRQITQSLQQMTTTIQDLRQQVDKQIADQVTEINDLISQIGNLNDKIVRNDAITLDSTDLRDQRDSAIDTLSKLVDISYFFRGDGDVIVFTTAGRTLVDNIPSTLTHSAASSVSSTTTHAEGDFGGIFVGSTADATNDITNELRGGSLKGLVELRDDVMTDLQSQIDELAAELRDTINQVHNRGFAFPGSQEMNGTRIFTQSATSTMTFSSGDTTMVLFDSNGDQQAVTTIQTLIGGASDSVNDVATAMQTWLQANGAGTATVAVGSDGKLAISLNTTTLNLAFRDETATASGNTHSDATITYDVDADGTAEETVSGFANFFGLNDFFVDGLNSNVYESNALASTFAAPNSDTLEFIDSNAGSLGTVAVTAGQSLSTIVSNINAANLGVTAAQVPDGSGFRLRISHDSGYDLEIAPTSGNFLGDYGMHVADVRVASTLDVRSDIIDDPSLVSRGAAQWNASLGASGEYFTSAGDDTIAKALGDVMTTTNAFDSAGGLASLTTTFYDYSSAIIGRSASLADTNDSNLEYRQNLADSLEYKSNTIRGVNLDEEMAQLILYEQAYAASARVISVIQDILDALERAL